MFGLLAGATTARPARAQYPPVVEGKVVDLISGSGVAGARIRVGTSAVDGLTEAGGAFSLRGLLPGRHTLYVEAAGYRAARVEIEARNGAVTSVRIELDPEPVPVQGLDVTATPGGADGATVLERSELDAGAGSDLAAALQDVPGLVVTRQGGPGSPAVVSIRGASPDEVLVLLDGVPVNGPLTGGADLSTVSLEGVERVTVVPGVQSARWGPRALGGVILVESRKPRAGETRGSVQAGSWGTALLAGGVGGTSDSASGPELAGRIGAEWRTTSGDFTYAVPDVRGGGTATRVNGDARMLTASASGSLRAADARLHVLADVLDLERGMPGPVVAPAPTARQAQNRVTLGAAATVDGDLRWDLALDAQRQHARFQDPTPPASPPVDEDTRARSLGGRLTVGSGWTGVTVEAGLDARFVDVASSSLDPSTPAVQRSLGVWVAATRRQTLGSRWTGTLTAALRGDRHTLVSGAEWSPRLGASVAGGRWTLRASMGSGFSPPTLADQFFQEGVLVRPNPGLRPERVRGEVDVGVDLRLLERSGIALSTTLDLYRGNVDGMILWFPDHRFVWSPDNFDVERTGWETGAEMSLAPAALRIRAAVARSSVVYRGDALTGQVVYRPEWTGNGSVAASWSPWSAEIATRWVGARRTVPGTDVNALDPYWITDVTLGAAWRLAEWRLTTRLTLENVFDAGASMLPDYPLPGRAWGLRLDLDPGP